LFFFYFFKQKKFFFYFFSKKFFSFTFLSKIFLRVFNTKNPQYIFFWTKIAKIFLAFVFTLKITNIFCFELKLPKYFEKSVHDFFTKIQLPLLCPLKNVFCRCSLICKKHEKIKFCVLVQKSIDPNIWYADMRAKK